MNLRAAYRRTGTRVALIVLALAALASVQGCFYLQAARGQFEIWQRSESLEEVIADPETDDVLATRLRLLGTARDFASERLGLPDNGSYRSYADLGRQFVLWNVFAAPEFSLEPKTWCYLVVGCLAYRGYFDERAALELAARLAQDGYDVHTGGVAAYSTLGKFSDPLLNTMLARDDTDLVALLFHELAHQKLFVRDDTAFNESFASAVAEFGLRQWFEARGDDATLERWLERQEGARARMRLIEEVRADLETLYAQSLPEDQMRQRKAQIFAALEARLSAAEGTDWSVVPMNNAWLASVSLYRGNLPAFRRLFASCERQWDCFYAEVESLAELSQAERADALAGLAAD